MSTGMGWIVLLSYAAATLGPISHIPTLRRIITKKTADGISLDLCGVALVSYGVWLILAEAVSPYMYAVIVVSGSLSLIETLYVRRLTGSSWVRVLGWVLAAAIGAALASTMTVAALFIILPIDISWYWRAISDIIRSRAALAVSTWGWVCAVAANSAWTVEAVANSAWVLAIQCTVLTMAAAIAWAAAAVAHRREGGKSTTRP